MYKNTLSINTAFILTLRETCPHGGHQLKTTILGIHSEEKEMVKLLVNNYLPKKMIGWSMRYNNWSQETYDTILKIVPELPTYDHYIIQEIKEDYMDECQYELTYADYGKCGDDSGEPDLTPTQREALYRVLGSSWYPSRHNEMHYEIEEVALVPIQKKGYGR